MEDHPYRETSSDVLEQVKKICVESNLEIPDSNLNRTHRIGKPYFDKIKKVKCKSITFLCLIVGRLNCKFWKKTLKFI